jgi:hypothetical protein
MAARRQCLPFCGCEARFALARRVRPSRAGIGVASIDESTPWFKSRSDTELQLGRPINEMYTRVLIAGCWSHVQDPNRVLLTVFFNNFFYYVLMTSGTQGGRWTTLTTLWVRP